MNSKQVIDYVCEVLNIKTDSHLIILDMVEDLKSINDLAEFRKVLKERVGNLNDDYKYLSGYQKFVKIVNEYKKQSNSADIDAIENYCLKIVKKCRNLSNVAYENKPKGYDFNHFIENAKYDCFMIDKKPAFNEKEIKLLNSVGGCKRWLRDYDENKFYENLVSAVYGLRKENTLAIEKKEFVQIENGINKRK